MPFCYFNPKKFSLMCAPREILFFSFYFTWSNSTKNIPNYPGQELNFPNWAFEANITNCSKIFSWYSFYMPKRKLCETWTKKETACASCALPEISSWKMFFRVLCYHKPKNLFAACNSLRLLARNPESKREAFIKVRDEKKEKNLNKFSNAMKFF